MDANCCQRMRHFGLSLPIYLKPVGGIPSHLGHNTFGKKVCYCQSLPSNVVLLGASLGATQWSECVCVCVCVGGGVQGVRTPPFVPRCRLFNINWTQNWTPVCPPPFFACRPNLDPPLSKILDPPLERVYGCREYVSTTKDYC